MSYDQYHDIFVAQNVQRRSTQSFISPPSFSTDAYLQYILIKKQLSEKLQQVSNSESLSHSIHNQANTADVDYLKEFEQYYFDVENLTQYNDSLSSQNNTVYGPFSYHPQASPSVPFLEALTTKQNPSNNTQQQSLVLV